MRLETGRLILREFMPEDEQAVGREIGALAFCQCFSFFKSLILCPNGSVTHKEPCSRTGVTPIFSNPSRDRLRLASSSN